MNFDYGQFKGSNLNRLKREPTEVLQNRDIHFQNVATDSLASEEPVSSDTDSREDDIPHSVPKYIKRKGNKKETSEKKQKKNKFLVTEDDQVDMSSLDRSVGGETATSDIVENFV